MKFISLTLLVSAAACMAAATTSVTPFVSFRSQGQDLARQRVGMIGHEYTYNASTDEEVSLFKGAASLTAEYTRSFNGDDLANNLFGCYYLTGCNKLNITGMNIPGTRAATDLAADWFYLPADYQGSITFEPVIQNFNADLNLYWSMDKWVNGMFFRVSAPLTWTKWDLGACFKTTVSGLDAEGVTYLHNAENFFCSKGIPTQTGVTYNPLTCARFCGCNGCDENTKTRLADIHADLGWNFLLDQDYHLGLFARVVAPTGNKAHAEWLFEPIVGNGGHWELGGGLTGSAILWRNQEEDKHFGFYVDANVTHLFNAKQNRVFDLKNLPLSRYMYATKNGQTSNYAPIANLTSCEMKVNVAVQADITAMFNYTSGNWSYDLGYNFWARSCEKFDCNSCDDCSCTCDTCNTCSSSCDSCCGACVIKNGNVDKWSLLRSDGTIHTVGIIENDLLLTDSMIDYEGARTKGLSNKVFGHVNYSWMDSYEDYVPFVGLGGFAEFGSSSDCCSTCSTSCNDNCNSCSCDNDCSCCKNVALSQWGVWLKGGVSF
jgi:hypothetical protein